MLPRPVEDLDDLGRTIRAAREHHGLSQWALAERIGVTQSHLSRLEGGGCRAVRLVTLQRLSEALGLSAADLLALAVRRAM